MDPDRAAAIADGIDSADGARRGATAGTDDATAIGNELHRYAELIDAGELPS